MKTFTTYAEKKAKQFLNLLQGYTKGIRLTAILILLLMGVNNVWGGNNVKVYCAIKVSDLNCYTLKVNANIGNNNTWRQYTMEKLDETYEGRLIYQATIVEEYGGVDGLQFQLYKGNEWQSQQQPYKSWTTSSTFANKLYVYDTDNWITKTNDPSYTVYFVNKEGWTGTIKAYAWNSDCDKNKDWSGADMTSTGNTYKGQNIYSITLNKQYANIIFNNGSSQTDDLTLGSTNIGKMYDGSNWVDYNVDPVVTFKANGGTGSDYTQTVKYNTSTALTANKFTRTGYSFNGWKTEANSGTSYADKANVTFKANTALYAQWTPAKYTITYKDQGGSNFSGTNKADLPAQHTYGTATTLVNGVKTGYTFGGWHTDQECTNKVTSLGATAYTANITLYAKWTINNHNITYNAPTNGTYTIKVGSNAAVSANTSADYNTVITLANTPNKGYHFTGWTTTPNITISNNQFNMPDNDVSISAGFEENTYTVTFNNNGGTGEMADMPFNYTATKALTANAFSKEGHTFNGWNTAANGSGTSYGDGATVGQLTDTHEGKVTLYAQWKANTYTVAFDANEGEGTMTPQNFTYGAAQNLKANSFTRTGYTFVGWATTAGGEKAYDDKQSVNNLTATDKATITLYAKWTINQYTINYGVCAESRHGSILLNGGDKVTESATSGNIAHGTTVTFTATADNDYKIEGWYSDANCANKIQAAGTGSRYTFTLTANTTVYVKFAEAAEVMSQVTISATEGGSVNPSGTVEVGNKTSSTITATPAAGYRFYRWEVTGGVVAPQDLTTATINITATYEGTLTAHFVRVYTVKYYATPSAAGNVTATANSANVASGATHDGNTVITFTATPTNNECNFIKWIDGAGRTLSTATTYNHTVVDDINVKAIFTINQYTLTFTAGEGGHVSATVNNSEIASPATLDYNTSVTLTAEPSANCAFDGWYEGATKVSSNVTYTITLQGHKTLEARFTKGTTIFFKPVDYWKADKARLAVYMWNSAGNKWIELEDYGCNGDIFTADIPTGYTDFKFARLRPAKADGYISNNDGLDWGNKWGDGETENLTVPTGDKNLYDMPKTYIHLKPNSNWTQASARFAAYFFGNGEKWVSMTDADGDGVYSCEKPNGYTGVVFCRMNSANNTNNWENRWDQTNSHVISNDNLFTINDGQWGGNGNNDSGATGTWSQHWDACQWTTYSAPKYSITLPKTTNGTIAVTYNETTTTSKTNAAVTISNVTLNDNVTVTFTPAAGYELINYLVEYANETETPGVFKICGPSEISAEFAPVATSRTIYLRPNEDWQKDYPIIAAYAYDSKNDKDYKWYVMSTKPDDYTGAYSCKVENKYDCVVFVRLNQNGTQTANGGLHWDNMWNQTKGLTILDTDNDATNDKKLRFAIGAKIEGGEDDGRYNGAWEENTPIWGLITNYNDWQAEKAIFMGYPGKLNVKPPFVPQHAFKLYNFIYTEGKYFGNSGTMKRENSGQWWTMDVNEQANCQMKLDAKGEYIYQMRFFHVGNEIRKQISVTYPDADNLYYVMYKDKENKQRISYAIPTAENCLDTISFFVDTKKDPYIYLLDGNKNIVGEGFRIVATGGSNPGGAMIQGRRNAGEKAELVIGDGCGVTESGVYNFVVQQEGGAQTFQPTFTHAYQGSYYIRTDVATGGWNAYKQAGNTMTYNSYADRTQNFNHYFCKWVKSSQSSYANVKFCVANDYSHKLSDELDGDEIIEKAAVPTGCLPEDANVRFGWNSKTNEVSRAYIAGATTATRKTFLHIIDAEALKSSEGTAVTDINFTDLQNWIYQVDVKATNATKIKLVADYAEKRQYFKGTEGNGEETKITLLSSTAQNEYDIRLIYNFKCNHLVAAMILNGDKEVTEDDALGADMMVIRKNQDKAEQLTFNPNAKKLSEVGTVYSVMTFTKGWITGTATERERSLYWVSFPFDVKISDVFGFGEYADHWIIQYYDGEERAKKGLFSDSGTYWKYIFNTDTELKAGQGYVLVLDLNKIAFPNDVQDVSLYFPSTGPLNTISGEVPTAATVPEYWCNIDREWTEGERRYHHKYTDSHWNLIGVPGFADINDFNVTAYHFLQGDASFYYNFNLASSTYTVENAATNFQAMYAYMVQFAGTINWMSKTISNTPEAEKLAAHSYSDDLPEKVVLRLELAQGEEVADRTFVQLQQEGATANFDLSLDLTKIVNIGVSNIYTLTDSLKIQTAGNVLPFEETTVAVGVDIATAGEYTFRMPDGTEGMVVELIDYETNTTTNLLLDDYTVNLPTGSNETRFALNLKPEKTATSIENTTTPSDSNIRKFIIDGKLYLQKDGMLYDAQGRCVQ